MICAGWIVPVVTIAAFVLFVVLLNMGWFD